MLVLLLQQSEQVRSTQTCLGIKAGVVGGMPPSLAYESRHNCSFERFFLMVCIADHLFDPVFLKLSRGFALWLGQLFHFGQRLFGHE